MSDLHRSGAALPVRRRIAGVASIAATVCMTGSAFAARQAPAALHAAPSEANHLQRETVEQRIHTLHADLGITPAEEPAWERVADVMRSNERTMRTMVASHRQSPATKVNAIDDLMVYEKFNQTHVEGIRKLIESFQPLYESMPDTQKTVADHVFRGFGRERPLHS